MKKPEGVRLRAFLIPFGGLFHFLEGEGILQHCTDEVCKILRYNCTTNNNFNIAVIIFYLLCYL